jgi:hypothetical protein
MHNGLFIIIFRIAEFDHQDKELQGKKENEDKDPHDKGNCVGCENADQQLKLIQETGPALIHSQDPADRNSCLCFRFLQSQVRNLLIRRAEGTSD